MERDESGFKKYLQQKKAGEETGLGTATRDELVGELDKRDKSINPFPLDVFPSQLKPFINDLTQFYDIPRSFVGLCLLSCYSTAIGTAYAVTTNGKDKIFMGVWGCLLGISSSGKSAAMDLILEPIYNIQQDFDKEWDEEVNNLEKQDDKRYMNIKAVAIRDVHVQTLIKSILPKNPKGLIKLSDELLEWINGLNALGKGKGTDEQFWLSAYNSRMYTVTRGGNEKYTVPRPFVNVLGGLQYGVLHRLFANDRDITGFVYRLLFAMPEADKISDRDLTHKTPQEYFDIHDNAVRTLYEDLPITDSYEEPMLCIMGESAIKAFLSWRTELLREINRITDLQEKDARSGIYGKITEYCQRFAGIICLMDKAMQMGLKNSSLTVGKGGDFAPFFKREELIDASQMERAIKLANYFYHTAWEAYERVDKQMTAPREVLQVAALFNSGKSLRQIAEIMYDDSSDKAKQKMARDLKKYIKEYPRVFKAHAK